MNLQPSPQLTAAYLRTLPAIRERCTRVHELAKQGKLEYFEYHPENEDAVAGFCVGIIQVGILDRSERPLLNRCCSQRDFGSDFSSVRT